MSTVRVNEVIRVLTRGCVILVVVVDTTANETQERERTPKTHVEPESFFASFLCGARKKGKEERITIDWTFFALCVTENTTK